MARLLIHYPDGNERAFPLQVFPLNVGRDEDNTLVLRNSRVPKQDFLIVRENGDYYLKNHSRKQCTTVNGWRADSAVLADGDSIQAGDVWMTFVLDPVDRTDIPEVEVDSKPEEERHEKALSPSGARAKRRIVAHGEDGDTVNIQASVDPANATLLRLAIHAASGKASAQELHKVYHLLQDITQEMMTRLQLSELLDYALAQICELLEAENGAILLAGHDKSAPVKRVRLVAKAVRQMGNEKASHVRITRALIQKACRERLSFLYSDAQTDEHLRGEESVRSYEIRSVMCAPLLLKGELLGMIHVDVESSRKIFSQSDLEFLTLLANQAALCVHSAELHDQIMATETRVAKVSAALAPQVEEKISSNEVQPLKAEGSKTEASVLCISIQDFSALTKQADPQAVLQFLDTFYSEMKQIILEFNGICERFTGEAILTVFGSAIPEPEHCMKAAQCAEKMIQRLGELEFPVGNVQVGVGLYSGHVIHGDVGSEDAMQHVVIGEAVETSLYLSKMAGSNQIVLSNGMRRALSGRIKTRPLGMALDAFELLKCS